jgi:hypothetical protein
VKFREIFRFKLRYQLRRVTPRLCFAVLLGFTLPMVVISTPTDDGALQNSSFGIAFFTVLGGVLWLLIERERPDNVGKVRIEG